MYNVLISHKYKFACFYNHKCGSGSVKRWFLETRGLPVFIDVFRYRRHMVNKKQIKMWIKHGIVNVHELIGYGKSQLYYLPKSELTAYYKNYYKFIVVRNPWKRLVSTYCGKVVKNPAFFHKIFHAHGLSSELSFRKFVNFICNLPEDAMNSHFVPQSAGLHDIVFDSIVKVENFDNGMAYVCGKLGLRYKKPAGNIDALSYNRDCKTSNCVADLPADSFDIKGFPGYELFYDNELKEEVARKYEKDINRFSYCFED